jgi:hypothetical protein
MKYCDGTEEKRPNSAKATQERWNLGWNLMNKPLKDMR